MRVVVAGAGVVGLLSAHALAHRGHAVEVLTRDHPLATTSATAGASFKPRLVDDSPDLAPLLRASRDVLVDWTRSGFAGAVAIRRHRHVVATAGERLDVPYLSHMDEVRWSRRADGDTLPGNARLAVGFTTWFFDVGLTLRALVDHLGADHDVTITAHSIDRLDRLREAGEVVVNATGLAAGPLVGDRAMEAVRGQVVHVRSPHLSDWDPDRSVSVDGAYLYPRPDGVLVGGTAEWGEVDTSPDAALARRLVEAAVPLAPGLGEVGDADLEPVVGLRPYRHGGVRLGRGRDVGGVPVVHAYGHGGAGWTLGPGTAERVADLVDAL